MTNLARRPLVPEDRNGHRPAMYLQRACLAHAIAASAAVERGPQPGESVLKVESTGSQAAAVAKKNWADGVTELVARGSVLPATTTDPDWAGDLARDAVGDFVSSLEPISAGSRLLNACPRISLARDKTLKFPRRAGPTAPVAHWIAELGEIPVPKFNITYSPTLGPTKKLACIAVMTRETTENAAGGLVLNTLLQEASALGLDTKLFSADAATDAAPPGLLNGIDPLTATAAGGDAAMMGDLDKIAAAIAPFTTGLVFVAHAVQANYLMRRRGISIAADTVIWPTLGVPAGTIIGLDPQALASAFGPEPEIRSGNAVVLHMEDTTPLPIAGEGSPAVVAAPQQSMFQTDCIATLLVLRAAWTWRLAGAIAWVQGATWK